ncbi:MAG: kinase [Candidatus Omnitrophica bacterium]|nr:kinase [Candidatus Omnitrophota bacterium]
MIISRTPYRISFFGGGTDYPVWYREHGGAVLATSIDKYCYITCRYLPPFFSDHTSRIVYSKIECVRSLDEIQHRAVRETLKCMDVREGVEIHHDGDLPARTGIGSSSSFTVGIIHALHALRHEMVTKMQLAQEAIHMERHILSESVGSQDQVIAACGGFKKIIFYQDDRFQVEPIILSKERLLEFQDHLMLYFTGFSRTASEIAAKQIDTTPAKKKELATMYKMVDEALSILTGSADISELGKLLEEAWKVKRSLTDKISTGAIDDIYETARRAGALGGKLLGAGGGGFILLFVRPEDQERVKEKLTNLLLVPFRFEDSGSQIIFYDPSSITREAWVSYANAAGGMERNSAKELKI